MSGILPSSMAAWVVSAPSQRLSGVSVTILRSSSRLMSTRRSISATRRLSIGISDWPPAMAAVVAPRRPSATLASATDFGRTYSNGADFMARDS